MKNGESIVEIKITYKCNFNCVFCVFGDKKLYINELCMNDLLNKLDLHMEKNYVETIHISGGEPTIFRNLERLLCEIKARKIKNIILHTNASLLADSDYANKISKYITHFFVSLHTVDPVVHEKITMRKNQLSKQIKGIRNIKKQILRF